MKIAYTKASPKHGIVEHVDNTTGRTLIAAGFAEHVPFRSFVEYMSETAATGSDPSNVNPPQTQSVEWACDARLDGTPYIVRKSGCETIRFEDAAHAAANDAPASVLLKFNNLLVIKHGADGARERIEQAKNEQYAREQQEKTARWGVLTARS